MKIKSTFAILDVTTGRAALNKHLAQKDRSKAIPIPVVIYGTIEDVHGGFDGVSQEFQVFVDRVEVPTTTQEPDNG